MHPQSTNDGSRPHSATTSAVRATSISMTLSFGPAPSTNIGQTSQRSSPPYRKTDRVRDWPIPTSAKQVRGFLGLVRYLSAFLPDLATHTHILDALTTKDCNRLFPPWTEKHQHAFDKIKRLATSPHCLTTIDASLMPQHSIFVTTDASDFGSGAILSFGPTYETARPVAFNSRAFKQAELNYPVHEKELLAIVRALGKWCTELLGYRFQVYTDHRTLEHFRTQCDLSRRQARWTEFLAQFEYSIHYLPGEKNVAADALSRLPPPPLQAIAAIFSQTHNTEIHSRFDLEDAILEQIKTGYAADPFTEKLQSAAAGMDNITQTNGYWFIDNRLVIPAGKHVRETLFQIAHDKLGHFGASKTYNALRHSFYWLHMQRDLEEAYIPSCPECHRNKARTSKPIGPLHPLPIPDQRCDSVAMDFIGPLPPDRGFDMILTLTDRSGSDVRLVPTKSTATTEDIAHVFFTTWYCENGLPLEIISDRNKLFVSRFWRTLHQLTGIDLKMSSAYHPQTDGSSERTNKTIIQCICFAVERDQRGWADALPKICFDLMNTTNTSTGFSPFQLRFGKSPRLLPPFAGPPPTNSPEPHAQTIINMMQPMEMEASDNLLTAKISQASHANTTRAAHFPFKCSDRVLLSTAHRRRTHNGATTSRAAKFFPRFNGPYTITHTNEKHSTVTLELPKHVGNFPVFHTSEVRVFHPNNDDLFPLRAMHPPPPVTIDSQAEHFLDKIIDECQWHGHTQYLMRWQGEGPEGDLWLPASELEACEALDAWQAKRTRNKLTITLPPVKPTEWGGV